MNKLYVFVAVAAIAVVSLGVVPESIASSSPASPAKSGKGRKTVYKDKEAVYNESAFFKAGTGVVEGKFEGPKVPGYLEYYGYNAFEENNKQACLLKEDGSFRLEIPLEYPIFTYFVDENNRSFYFYLEPGKTVQMTVGPDGKAQYAEGTPCANLCRWMNTSSRTLDTQYRYWEIPRPELATISFPDYAARVKEHQAGVMKQVDSIIVAERFSAKEAHLLRHQTLLSTSLNLFAFSHLPDMPGTTEEMKAQRQKDLSDPAQYELLRQLDPKDLTWFSLPNEMYFMSNRYSFSPLMRDRLYVLHPAAEILAADKAIFGKKAPSVFMQAVLQGAYLLESEFLKKADRTDERLAVMDSPWLKARYARTVERLRQGKPAVYALPDGPGTDILNRLLEPYRGKWVYLDFWSTGCGPCRVGIERSKELRAKVREMDDFVIIFIAGRGDTPEKTYKSYVEKNMPDEISLYLPQKEFVMLSVLFQFNGIPHNELVTPDGKIATGRIPRLEDKTFLEQIGRIREGAR